MAKKAKILNFKELAEKREQYKGYFRSRGISTIKKTDIVDGKPVVEYIQLEIAPVSDHPAVKEFMKKYPKPKPPVKRDFINISTGKTPTQEGVGLQEAKNSPNYQWANVYDYANEKYQEELEEWNRKVMLLYIMVCFNVTEEFGIDKIDEFESWLMDLGFTANQLNKIGEDIKNLDFLSPEKQNSKSEEPLNGISS